MEARPKRRVNRLKLARLQVAVFLIFIFGIGFLTGRISGSSTAPKQTVVIEPPMVSNTPSATPSYTPTPVPSEEPIEIVATEPPIKFYDVPLTESLQEYIMLLCEQEQVPVPLILAMIEQESTFQSEVVSKTNDYGLMQINQCNHDWLSESYGITDFLDPYQNVLCGISLIGGYLSEYEDVTKALMCYNTGEYGANRLWDKGITSTSYSRSVLAKMTKYEEVNDGNGIDD